jgi:hypothetical protein
MMDTKMLLEREVQGSVDFFLHYSNLDPNTQGFGLTVDATKNLQIASIAATGSALSAWVIAAERSYLSKERAVEITRGTLHTLLHHAPQHRGFFAHFLDMKTAARIGKCEYSTIDSALCLNGVITAAAYFQDNQIREMAQQLLERVDWNFIVFESEGQTRFRMAYNPDLGGDYVTDAPGFISQWDMAAEQKMMYLQAANHVEASVAKALYQGFRRDKAPFNGKEIIICPGGTLFVYQFSEAWLDTAKYLNPDGIDWFENTRLASLANRQYCIENAKDYKTFHENSWGLSAGDSPWGYEVAHGWPRLNQEQHSGTVSIYSAISCLPYIPDETLAMIEYLYQEHPQTWGRYGFFDAYNLTTDPAWYSTALYGIDKGCSMLMVENYLSGLIWNTYTNSPYIQKALNILGFQRKNL